MASSYTEHFQLNQWAAEDPVLREDFNADNAKLDKVIPRIVTGTYTGDGTADRTIYLGFRPKAVLLFRKSVQAGSDNDKGRHAGPLQEVFLLSFKYG